MADSNEDGSSNEQDDSTLAASTDVASVDAPPSPPAAAVVTTTPERQKPWVSQPVHLLTAALTGLLYYISFPGVDFWPLAFFAWTPWLIGLRGRTPKQAVVGGLVIGLVVGFTGFYWLIEMLETFSGFPLPLCVLFMTILCAYQGGRFMLLGWLFTRARDRGWNAGLVFTLAFIASETIYPMLFPFTFGATVHDVIPLVQVGELGGPIAIALTLLAPSWALYRLIDALLEARAERAENRLKRAFELTNPRVLGLLVAVPLISALYGLVRMHQVDAAVANAEKLRVGIVQANMGLAEKRQNYGEGKRRHLQATKKLRKDKVDLVVWPETSISGAVKETEANEYYKQTLTRSLKVPTIMGAVLARPVDDAREYVLFNSALLSNEKGDIVGRYDKQFLLAFGEYLPFGETFPKLYEWSPNSGRFTPGTSFEPLHWNGHDIATFICYEDIAPSFVNKLMRHGDPELLVNMTNDAWFGDSSEPWEHMALSQLRAVEQRRFFVRSTNSGVSGFVDPNGRWLQKTPTFQQAAISQEVAWLKLWTPYRLWGDIPWWLGTFAAIGLAFRRRAVVR